MSKFLLLGIGSLIMSLISCGSSQLAPLSTASTNTDGSSGQYSGQNLEGGAVSQLPFESNNTATFSLSSESGSESYVVALYSYNESGTTQTYQLAESASSRNLGIASLISGDGPEEDITTDVHALLRELEQDLDPEALLPSQSPKAAVKFSTPSIGSTDTFKVLNSLSGSSSYTTVTAELRYATDDFLAYVDVRDKDSLSEGELKALLDDFQGVIDAERDLFGTESDVDGNERFYVLFTHVINQLGGSSGGIVTGFFYAVDLFSSSQYSQSNQKEMINVFVPDPSGSYGTAISKSFALSNILPSVLPHEYQHMINFNMHYFQNSSSPELSFLNEGLAHLAEDIYSMNDSGYMEATGPENPARVSGFLSSIDDLCITCGASLYQRGGSYLLTRYMYEQAQKGNFPAASTGRQLLQRLLNTSTTGVDNLIMAAYGEGPTDERFRDLIGQFGLALFMSDTGLTTDNRLEISGISLREEQNDNRGTILYGPTVNSLNSSITNTVANSTISFVEITAADINDAGGSFTLQLNSNAQVGAYLIQTGL